MSRPAGIGGAAGLSCSPSQWGDHGAACNAPEMGRPRASRVSDEWLPPFRPETFAALGFRVAVARIPELSYLESTFRVASLGITWMWHWGPGRIIMEMATPRNIYSREPSAMGTRPHG